MTLWPGHQAALGLGGLDHRQPDPVLHGAGRVHRLELAEHLGAGALGDPPEPHHRRPPDQLGDGVHDGHARQPTRGRRCPGGQTRAAARAARSAWGRAPRCEMTSAAASEPRARALRERATGGEAVQEAGRVQVAGAGRVDELLDRGGGHLHRVVGGHDHRAVLGAGDHDDLRAPAHRAHGLREVAGLGQREDLLLVGEEHVNVVLDERAELLEMALDAERVGERQGDPPARAVRGGHRHAEGVLGAGLVPEVALEVRHGAAGDQLGVDVLGAQLHGRAEVGGHRAVRVRGHQDQAQRGRRPVGRDGGVEVDARPRGCRGRRRRRAGRRGSCRCRRRGRRTRRCRPCCWPRRRPRPRRPGPCGRTAPRTGRPRSGSSTP